MQAPVATPFIPLGVLGGSLPQETAALAQPELEAPELEPLRPSDSGVGTIEIALPNGARVSVDAFVNEKALSRVLRAMKGST
jgi:transposase